MTGVLRLAYVDVYPVRGRGTGVEILALRRGTAGRCPGSWEAVHGHIEPGEPAHVAALRELREETGLGAARLYNLSRVETFYSHRHDAVMAVPVFAAFVEPGAVVLGPEHDHHEWLRPEQAALRYAWPREKRAVYDVLQLLGTGDAGALEDVLRIC